MRGSWWAISQSKTSPSSNGAHVSDGRMRPITSTRNTRSLVAGGLKMSGG